MLLGFSMPQTLSSLKFKPGKTSFQLCVSIVSYALVNVAGNKRN